MKDDPFEQFRNLETFSATFSTPLKVIDITDILVDKLYDFKPEGNEDELVQGD
jgi:hypothetical protein